MIRESIKKTLSLVGLDWVTGFSWYRQVLDACTWPEKTASEIDRKVERFRDLANRNSFGRTLIWQELARLERIRGHQFIASIFALRAFRLAGQDETGVLPWVCDTLCQQGLERDANAAQAMFRSNNSEERFRDCYGVLEAARQTHTSTPEPDYQLLDDQRGDKSFRVSIIVSMYNAEDKLKAFLDLLLQQTLVERGQAELIFLDSASPTKEYQVVREHPLYSRGILVYARSNSRETIQFAWNRALALTRAPYIMMLCVDEACAVPDCLEILAHEMDLDPHLDWLQANCRVTEVDDDCRFLREIFMFDRTGYVHGCEYLETGYLSYVGALIRRSVYERFGYYDPSFRCAGDTEFKNRVLPFITTRMYPKTLGVFLNYPDARNSDQPRAELEDLRAWHLYRTPAGIEYSWGPRTPTEAIPLAWKAMHFRKSYDTRTTTDFEYAYNLDQWLKSRVPSGELPPQMDQLLNAARTLDNPPRSLVKAIAAIRKAHRQLQNLQRVHQTAGREADYRYFTDDRFDHHKTIWPAPVS